VALQRSGIDHLDDVILIDVPGEKAAEEFIQGKVDAVMTWEPFVTEAIEKGGGRKLFDSSEISGVSPLGWVFRRQFIQDRPRDVVAFVNVWLKTTEFIKKNPQEAFKIIADIYKVAPLEVENLTHKDRILDLDDNLAAFTHSKGFESLYGTAGRINNYLAARGITDKKVDCEKIFDGRFIRKLKK
jgi:NitT/TauT family transport system substrate-binding protein